MKLTEYKTAHQHYFLDEDGRQHGLYQDWYDNECVWEQRQCVHGEWHGEFKLFKQDGSLTYHEWYEHGDLKLNFLKGDKYPTDEEERLIFKLTYQGEFLPKMKLTECKTARRHYFLDEDGRQHGLYQDWYDNECVWEQRQYNHGLKHGEYKIFNRDGLLFVHMWYENNKRVLDFLKDVKYPTDEEELLIFKLTYQGEFIPK